MACGTSDKNPFRPPQSKLPTPAKQLAIWKTKPQGISAMLLKIPHAAERSAFSFSAPLNRYMTVTTALPPALTKRAADDPAAL